MTLEEADRLIQTGDQWDWADAILEDVYPGWRHIQNHGLLRGAIAAVLKVMKDDRNVLLGAAKLAQLWLANCVPTVELDDPKPLPVLAAAIGYR
jgi:hypothetical protein